MGEAAHIEQKSVSTAAEMKSHVQRIQEVQRSVMKPNVHYGQIPGTNKPTLYKPGSEVLLMAFHISIDPDIEDLSTSDEVHYRVLARGIHQATGIVMGVGVGECSSTEEKYKWRASICDEEFDATDSDRRRVVYKRGKQGSHYTIKQIRTEAADMRNTVLKMAKKRAQIDFTLTALAASDIFDQDLEDLPDHLRETQTEARPTPQPTNNANDGFATEKQIHLLKAKANNGHIDLAQLCQHFGIKAIGELPFAKVNDALQFIKENEVPFE